MAANDNSQGSAPPARSTSQIEADLVATRQRLTAAVETLVDQVHPNRIKQRGLDRLRRFADTQLETARSLVFNARGDLRKDRLIAVGAAAAGGITFLLLVRRLARRGRDD